MSEAREAGRCSVRERGLPFPAVQDRRRRRRRRHCCRHRESVSGLGRLRMRPSSRRRPARSLAAPAERVRAAPQPQGAGREVGGSYANSDGAPARFYMLIKLPSSGAYIYKMSARRGRGDAGLWEGPCIIVWNSPKLKTVQRSISTPMDEEDIIQRNSSLSSTCELQHNVEWRKSNRKEYNSRTPL